MIGLSFPVTGLGAKGHDWLQPVMARSFYHASVHTYTSLARLREISRITIMAVRGLVFGFALPIRFSKYSYYCQVGKIAFSDFVHFAGISGRLAKNANIAEIVTHNPKPRASASSAIGPTVLKY